ncbi:uncharacterized protein K460DRAFT_278260 [Cucurbitaria berberidis CBS 394.84]|uniref:PNPLA domain-containing protein n=1 Tax=Cucurbitaria berberidis CBS 394.84 TaxID=1168544 RepID=A0A9P4LAL6_9PLEO|nr:uncharacterized protein K460DRAFT_278260 [Cucurbitaria berberidis CBS 394.84]KAF1847324.1 hypothetical protein K460DRAFT_278260 [Cucurbitaria berberidis CBS 394.84]
MSSYTTRKSLDAKASTLAASLAPDIPVSRSSKETMNRVTSRDPPKSLMKAIHSFPHGRPETELEDQSPKTCESCEEHTSPIWNCSYCGMNFCDPCWGKQGPHKRGRTAPDGLPHEKANPSIVRRFRDILTPPKEHLTQEALHREDEDTTWFGLARDKDNKAILQDYGRYTAIMAESYTGDYQSRYPQLVSFIGQTGAGKSTLIRMLIEQQETIQRARGWKFPSPVVGSLAHGNVPTSGDVHLYSDPSTYSSEYPILLADCEGLEGGENIPISAQYRESSSTVTEKKAKDKDSKLKDKDSKPKTFISRGINSSRRELKWATCPEKKKRQYAVTELYPRLLYTFSDVIVFVLRNPKTFESTVLSTMLNWARSSIEKSLNQPTLPHVVIALNVTDTRIDEQAWDPEHATRSLMADVAGAVDRDPNYKELKTFWVARGKTIATMQDLLECYYSSITVVRIPGDGRYMMINTQVQTLHDTLSRRCKESFNAKRRSRMLSTSENLNIYLQSAFDHFSNDLDTPFNFMDVSFQINPIPLDLGGNILKLAVAMMPWFSSPWTIFEELSFMVASCILLDCVRQNLRGPPQQIFENHYLVHCYKALENFCAGYWPCTYQGRYGDRCVNVEGSHSKGHQNARGRIMREGSYMSDFTFEDFGEPWLQFLNQHLAKMQTELNTQLMQPPSTDELEIVTKLHRANIDMFYQRLGGAQRFVSHQTCFSCLRELAEHPLPCGHVLCTPCIKSYGKPDANLSYSYAMASCPLHQADTVFPVHWPVFFKPPLAGVRILSLDGGGVRGVVILEVLSRIQQELGNQIPIQDFFDLIIGTSTGGIVALALGIKGWPIAHCIKSFKTLMLSAFTQRFPRRLGKSKYETKPLDACLAETFGEETMFAGVPSDSAHGCLRKVAVTAATETGEKAVIFANYNRKSDSEGSARATSAAPTYFKPFVNSRTKEAFLDGAIHYNNPVRIANYESMLLWPTAEGRHPDILLSIGTAFNEPRPEDKKNNATHKPYSEPRAWYTIFKRHVKNFLDAELTWNTFLNDVMSTSSPIAAQRYVRLNPKLAISVPKMDDVKSSGTLQTQVKNELNTTEMQVLVEKVAHRLISSSFYFDKTGTAKEYLGSMAIEGTIKCRFATESENLRHLGANIKTKFKRRNFQPFFRVHEVTHDENAQDIQLGHDILEDMIEVLDFRMDTITIPVTSESALVSIDLHLTDDAMKPELRNGFPISGFPRSLADDEPLKRPTSPPSTPLPTPPAIASKRQSLRAKQSLRRVSDESVKRGQQGGLHKSTDRDNTIPEMEEHVEDWARRLSEGVRPPNFGRPSSNQGSMNSLTSLQQLDEAVGRYVAVSDQAGKDTHDGLRVGK